MQLASWFPSSFFPQCVLVSSFYSFIDYHRHCVICGCPIYLLQCLLIPFISLIIEALSFISVCSFVPVVASDDWIGKLLFPLSLWFQFENKPKKKNAWHQWILNRSLDVFWEMYCLHDLPHSFRNFSLRHMLVQDQFLFLGDYIALMLFRNKISQLKLFRWGKM